MLNLLHERGHAITKSKWDRVKRVNTKLTQLVQTNFELLTTPVVAFISMETEESARFLFQMVDIEILGETCILKKVTDPTNIKWENQMPKSKLRIVRKIVILCLTVTFITIMTLNLARVDHDFF